MRINDSDLDRWEQLCPVTGMPMISTVEILSLIVEVRRLRMTYRMVLKLMGNLEAAIEDDPDPELSAHLLET